MVLWVLAACSLCYLCESFQAWAWPALDGYPAIERWIDPSFLKGDFYTDTTAAYNVDSIQAWLFGGLQKATGAPYAVTIAVLTALRHLLFPPVIYALLKELSGSKLAALLGVVLGVVAAFGVPKTLGWQWLWGDGSPAMFAAIFATGGWVLLLKRQVWPSLILMAAAALAQPLVAVHGGIFYAVVFLVDFNVAERRRALMSPAAWIAALVFLASFGSQYVMLKPPAAERLPDADYIRILVNERHPTDFLPSQFDAPTTWAFLLAALGLGVMLAGTWRGLARRRLMGAVLLVYAAICVLGSVFVEIMPVRFAADLIPFRTVIIAAPVMLTIVGAYAAKAWRDGAVVSLALLAMAVLIGGPVGQAAGVPAHAIAGGGLLLAAALAGLLPAPKALADFWRTVTPMVWPIAILLLVGLSAAGARFRHQFMSVPTLAHSHPVYAWARTTTPGSRFLIEQFPHDPRYNQVISPQRMRLIGRRPVAASMDFPFADRNLKPWLKTWAVGLDHGKEGFVENADLARLQVICADLPFDYVVRVNPLAGATPVMRFRPADGMPEVLVYAPCAPVAQEMQSVAIGG